MRRFCYAIFLSIDLFFSAITFGDPYETISARLGQARSNGRPKWAIYLADTVDWLVFALFGAHNHCQRAIARYLTIERDILT